MNIQLLQAKLRRFAVARDWEQFHSPKNLVMALAGEVGELSEVFQWMTEDQSNHLTAKQRTAAEEEIADVALYLLRLCDRLSIDLEKAVKTKLVMNTKKYPVRLAKGNAKKYTEFGR